MLTEQEEGKLRNIIDAFDNGKSVTELNAATTLGNNDVMEVLQGGESKKVPVSVVKTSVNSDVLTDLNKRGVFNVTVSVPLTAGSYYTLSTAIAAVPTASKTLGLDIKFATAANTWVVYRYKGSDLTGWATTTNWEQVPDAAKLSSLETDLNTIENDLYGGFVSEIMNGVAHNGYYMDKNSLYMTVSSSGAAIMIIPCVAGDYYEISIPKTNNSAGYFLAYNYDNIVPSANKIVGVPGCIGTGLAAKYTIESAENYPFICIGYTSVNGMPTVKHTYYRNKQFVKEVELSTIENKADLTKNIVDSAISYRAIINKYDGSSTPGYITSSGGLQVLQPYLSSGLIPVHGGKFYYVNRPYVNNKYATNLRVVGSDRVTKMYAQIATTGEDSNSWYQRTEDGASATMRSQIKIPENGAYLQFTMWFSEIAPTEEELTIVSKIMIQEVGNEFNPNFVPDNFTEPDSIVYDTKIKNTALDNSDIINSVKKSLKILFIGNSFLDACINYAPFILYNLTPNIDVTIVELIKGGSSLSDWYNIITGVDTSSTVSPYIFKKGETKWTQPSLVGATLQDKVKYALRMYDYDAIVFQQVSTSVGDYNSYQPYLNNIIKEVFSIVNHPVRLGWLLTPTNDSNYANSLTVFNDVITSVNKLLDETAIEFVIPCGTALQNARTTILQTLGDDGNLIKSSHPQAGVPCQTLAYTMVIGLYDLIGINNAGIYGENTRVDAVWSENKGLHDLQGLPPNSPVVTTDEYARIAQVCAMVASKKPLEVTDCSAL